MIPTTNNNSEETFSRYGSPSDIPRLVLDKDSPRTWYSQRGGKYNRICVELALKGKLLDELYENISHGDLVPVQWSVLLQNGEEVTGKKRSKYAVFSVKENCNVEESSLEISLSKRVAQFYFRYCIISKKSGGSLRIKFKIGDSYQVITAHTQVLTKKNQKRKRSTCDNLSEDQRDEQQSVCTNTMFPKFADSKFDIGSQAILASRLREFDVPELKQVSTCRVEQLENEVKLLRTEVRQLYMLLSPSGMALKKSHTLDSEFQFDDNMSLNPEPFSRLASTMSWLEAKEESPMCKKEPYFREV